MIVNVETITTHNHVIVFGLTNICFPQSTERKSVKSAGALALGRSTTTQKSSLHVEFPEVQNGTLRNCYARLKRYLILVAVS